MKKLRNLIRKLRGKETSASGQLIRELRKIGVAVGEDVTVYDPKNTTIDKTAPWLLTIGNHVRITSGVKILTHDYAWSVLKGCTGGVLGAQSPVTIGNNVFIGMNTVITRGVTIGDNVVIGAGSVVTKDCPSDGVYAGNPAKRIMSIDEYYEKRRSRQFEEARILARQYKLRYGAEPPKEALAEYFMLFCGAEEARKVPEFRQKMELVENLHETVVYMEQHSPMFADYKLFLRACFSDKDN